MIPVRHLCVSKHHRGRRWLLAMNFHTHPTNRTGLQSWCRTCTRINHRAAHTSARIKAASNEYSRRVKERQRRESGIPPRILTDPRFDPDKLMEYLDQFYFEGTHSGLAATMNGVHLTDADRRWILRLKKGEMKEPPSPEIVDRMSVTYDIPFWELVEAAGRYKKDKRTIKREMVS